MPKHIIGLFFTIHLVAPPFYLSHTQYWPSLRPVLRIVDVGKKANDVLIPFFICRPFYQSSFAFHVKTLLLSKLQCRLSFARQDGFIKTEVVYAILLRSNLPREVLGYIWDMCNKATPGQLTREELFLILAMISIAQVSVVTSC